MIETTACVPTANAEKYLMSLCDHWGEGMELDVRERQGVVHFGDAVATLTPSHDQLVVTILASDDSTVKRIQEVVSRNLDRFALREGPLKFDWRRSSDLTLGALSVSSSLIAAACRSVGKEPMD